MNRSRREDSFLDDPASRIQRGVLDTVVPKVMFHELEFIVWQLPFRIVREPDGNRLSARTAEPFGKQPAVGIDVVAGCETDMSISVDVGHGAGFGRPI